MQSLTSTRKKDIKEKDIKEKDSKNIYRDMSRKYSAMSQNIPKMKRQTHMHCTICNDIAESYSQKECKFCGSRTKWSIPWKNENHHLYLVPNKNENVVERKDPVQVYPHTS